MNKTNKTVEYVVASDSSLLCGYVEDIVASDEGVTVFVLELSIQVFFTLLQRYVHVAIQTGQHTYGRPRPTCVRMMGGQASTPIETLHVLLLLHVYCVVIVELNLKIDDRDIHDT